MVSRITRPDVRRSPTLRTLPALRTERLLLRRWCTADLAPFAKMSADPTVMEHFPELLTRERSDAMVARIRDHFAREGFGLWALEVPAAAPFIGFTGLARPVFMPEVVEIGWRLAPAYWRQGYATEAAKAALRWAFEVGELDEIVAFVVPSNTPSQRVMDRLGMTRDPTADFEHPMIATGHRLRPHWLYRLSRSCWSNHQSRQR